MDELRLFGESKYDDGPNEEEFVDEDLPEETENSQIYTGEKNVFDRVGVGRGTIIGGTGKEAQLQEKMNRSTMELPDLITIDFQKLKELFGFQPGYLNLLIDGSSKVKFPNYKNPTCFILGNYVLSGNHKEINELKLKKVKENLPHLDGIEMDDVIRYARLWMGMN